MTITQQYHNPFSNIGIIAPIAQRDAYDQYCQTRTTGKATIDRTPFRRTIDLWFTGLALAARRQLRPINFKDHKTFRLTTGATFDRNSWQIQALMLIAIAVDESVEVVQNPRRMMDIANSLAAAGVPYIVEMLREGNQYPIWNLSDALDDLLRSDSSEEAHKDNKNLFKALNEVLRR